MKSLAFRYLSSNYMYDNRKLKILLWWQKNNKRSHGSPNSFHHQILSSANGLFPISHYSKHYVA